MVRLKAYQIGPRGGRKLVASKIVSRENAGEEQYEWEHNLNDGGEFRYEVLIQDGPIRPRV